MRVTRPILMMAALAVALTVTTTSGAAPRPPCKEAKAPLSDWCKKAREVHRVSLRVDRALASTPMRGLGIYYARSGRRHDVNPLALVAISGVESSYGAARCGFTRNGYYYSFNVWGLGSCFRAWSSTGCVNGGRVSLYALDSWRTAIDTAARFIRCRWPNANSVYDLVGYCPGCPWMEKVDSLMPGSGLRWRDALR